MWSSPSEISSSLSQPGVLCAGRNLPGIILTERLLLHEMILFSFNKKQKIFFFVIRGNGGEGKNLILKCIITSKQFQEIY